MYYLIQLKTCSNRALVLISFNQLIHSNLELHGKETRMVYARKNSCRSLYYEDYTNLYKVNLSQDWIIIIKHGLYHKFILLFHKFKSLLQGQKNLVTSVFGSVVVVAFQIVFRAKIHVNDVFLFFKNYFWYQHIKMIWKH
jgi:hypothetical protein